MTKWILEHKETISLLIVVALGILAGVALGGVLVFISGFWLVASGDLDNLLLASWGY